MTAEVRPQGSFGPRPSLEDYVAGVRAGNRAMLARAITLIESGRAEHQALAQDLLQALLPYTGRAVRLGITGVPGVGKSTTIDQLGINLVEAGHKIAVLAVDPTSTRSGGSILGDKTRMNRLANHAHAYVRPSPTSGTLGGVARKTRETMAIVEAAGYDIVIVETVGVGQSEVTVAEMVDFFLVLLLPGGGDELQGIKKGIIEIADMIAINKADGDNTARASRSAADYRGALGLIAPHSEFWQPPVITISGRDNIGLDVLWQKISDHRARMQASGEFEARRAAQAVGWMHAMLTERLMAMIHANPEIATRLKACEARVRDGGQTPARAVEEIMGLVQRGLHSAGP
ncbi:MAG TPA: methylmalonyl Co-A mutase-associated GTPase MeaB [Hyphomicrobiaceae bacterium]|nr:methylmalonyl Co-A mutase-associated GTPase MeaB [Hyphomicrobiaceae bacterium]